MSTLRLPRWFGAIPVALLLAAVLLVMHSPGTRVVAYFGSAPGLYVGDAVKVMGVPVGKVRSVRPEGDRVRVELEVGSQPIPAAARAAIVAPSLVSERFVQLAPAYTGGARLRSGGVIPLDRTAIPVSFDEVKRELTDLAGALGPRPGAGPASGSLNQVIRTLDANLGPDAAVRFRESMAAMRGATASLANGSDDLFTTLRNLNVFVENLAVNDRAARTLINGLARFGGTLDSNKRELGSAIAGLDTVLRTVRQFVRDNQDALGTGVGNLEQVARTLASRSNDLAGFLQAAPNAVANLYNMFGTDGAVGARFSLAGARDLAQLVCGSVLGVGGTVAQCKAALGPLLQTLGLRGPSALPAVPAPSAPTTRVPTTRAPLPASGLPLLDGLLASLTGGAP